MWLQLVAGLGVDMVIASVRVVDMVSMENNFNPFLSAPTTQGPPHPWTIHVCFVFLFNFLIFLWFQVAMVAWEVAWEPWEVVMTATAKAVGLELEEAMAGLVTVVGSEVVAAMEAMAGVVMVARVAAEEKSVAISRWVGVLGGTAAASAMMMEVVWARGVMAAWVGLALVEVGAMEEVVMAGMEEAAKGRKFVVISYKVNGEGQLHTFFQHTILAVHSCNRASCTLLQ